MIEERLENIHLSSPARVVSEDQTSGMTVQHIISENQMMNVELEEVFFSSFLLK